MNSGHEQLGIWPQARKWAGWGLCVLPLLALAEAPMVGGGSPKLTAAQAAPAPGESPAPDSPDMRPRGDARRFGMNGPGGSNPVTDQEWQQAEEWMKANAPRRWAFYQNLRATNPRASFHEFREYIAPRIRQLYWLQQHDKPLYDVRMQRVKLEDEAFGLLQDMKSTTKPAGTNDELTAALKQKVGDLYDNTLTERALRIQELQALLLKQQKELTQDQEPDKRDKHIDENLKRILDTGSLDTPRDNQPRGANGGGPRGNGEETPSGPGPGGPPAPTAPAPTSPKVQ
jgi:hypothetical protein